MKKQLLLFIIIICFTSCANMVVPTGGKKDSKVPELIKSNLSKTNFNENHITLHFNEYVQLNDAENNISLQPKHTKLSIIPNGKTIRINFDSALKSNTTYSLTISKGITDINESNGYNFSYVFSTGQAIDTNFVQYEINNLQKYKNLKIGLTTQNVDSLAKLKFDYLYSIKEPLITINGLNQTLYKTWIFTDLNSDNIPDWYSPIFYDTIHLNTSKKIEPDLWVNPNSINIKYYKNFTKVFKNINDPITYGFNQVIYIDKDSALFYYYNNDTLPTLDFQKELKDKIANKILVIKNNKDYNIIIDKCGIKNISLTDRITYREDENYFYINTRVKPDSINFQIKLLNDSIQFYCKINQFQELNKLSTLRISKNPFQKEIIVYLYKDQKLVTVKKINLNTDQIFYLTPGQYKIEFYNTGLYKNISFDYSQLRRISIPIIKKEIILKPNWDEVLQLIFP